MSGFVRLLLLLILVIIFIGIAIDTLIHLEVAIDVIKTYLSLVTGYGILLFSPVFLLSMAVGITITRPALRDD